MLTCTKPIKAMVVSEQTIRHTPVSIEPASLVSESDEAEALALIMALRWRPDSQLSVRR